MFVTVELLYGTQEGGKGKGNDRASTTCKCITSLQVKDITICIESC
jgi:hypothetical protein